MFPTVLYILNFLPHKHLFIKIIICIVYWEGFNRSIKSYSSIISHITSAQHNVEDLQGLLYTIEKIHGQESILKDVFSTESNSGVATSSSGSTLSSSQSGDDKGGDALKITISKATSASPESVLTTQESKTKLTNLYSRYLESCETLALYDKMYL